MAESLPDGTAGGAATLLPPRLCELPAVIPLGWRGGGAFAFDMAPDRGSSFLRSSADAFGEVFSAVITPRFGCAPAMVAVAAAALVVMLAAASEADRALEKLRLGDFPCLHVRATLREFVESLLSSEFVLARLVI